MRRGTVIQGTAERTETLGNAIESDALVQLKGGKR